MLTPKARPSRKIEFYGDDVTAGYEFFIPSLFYLLTSISAGVLATAPCTASASNQDVFLYVSFTLLLLFSSIISSYAMDLARELEADYSIIASTGMTVALMNSIYNQAVVAPSGAWTFSKWVPDVVVMNLGRADLAAGVTAQNFESRMLFGSSSF